MRREGPWLLLVVACLAGLALAARWLLDSLDDVGGALATMDPRLLGPILGLVVIDYTLRYLRWRYLFRLAAARSLAPREEIALYLAGNSLILTPARAGELVRSLYASRLYDMRVSETAAVVLVERVVDTTAMLALVGVGAVLLGGVLALAILAATFVAGVVLIRSALARSLLRRLFDRVVPRQGSLPAATPLLRIETLAVSFGLGFLAWSVECVCFALVLVGLGFEPGVATLAGACFVYPLATLAGALSFLPGGLGVTEGGIAGLLTATLGASAAAATAAALLIRAAIIAPALLSGLAPLVVLTKLAARTPASPSRETLGEGRRAA